MVWSSDAHASNCHSAEKHRVLAGRINSKNNQFYSDLKKFAFAKSKWELSSCFTLRRRARRWRWCSTSCSWPRSRGCSWRASHSTCAAQRWDRKYQTVMCICVCTGQNHCWKTQNSLTGNVRRYKWVWSSVRCRPLYIILSYHFYL